MKFKTVFLVLAVLDLLFLTQVVAAQGTSGGNGVVASIPGSVVRGHEQGPGLISILTGSPPPSYSQDPKPGARRVKSDAARLQRPQ